MDKPRMKGNTVFGNAKSLLYVKNTQNDGVSGLAHHMVVMLRDSEQDVQPLTWVVGDAVPYRDWTDRAECV
jgi:hypothetical protein